MPPVYKTVHVTRSYENNFQDHNRLSKNFNEELCSVGGYLKQNRALEEGFLEGP
jgi:hypothetical protein